VIIDSESDAVTGADKAQESDTDRIELNVNRIASKSSERPICSMATLATCKNNSPTSIVPHASEFNIRPEYQISHSGRLPWSSPEQAVRKMLAPLIGKAGRRSQVNYVTSFHFHDVFHQANER
jgi:hypothetical protein